MSLSPTDARLIEAAIQASKGAYAPYSRYHVGSAVLMRDGRMGTGANIENASYGVAICAETNAITTLIAERHGIIARLAVVAYPSENPQGGVLGAPCGRCRQVIAEFSDSETTVLIAYPDGRLGLQLTLDELFPHSFGPAALGGATA
ncbi:MAG: cytidine deaminase [Pseudomonadota bacterium]